MSKKQLPEQPTPEETQRVIRHAGPVYVGVDPNGNPWPGMMLRDLCAIEAMKAVIQSSKITPDGEITDEWIANTAWVIADAMIKVRGH